jgi:hypothetical protein
LEEDVGALDAAVLEYRKGLAVDPQSADAKVMLAFALLRTGQVDEARRIADDLVARGGGNPWLFATASRIRGNAELAEGRTEAALEQLERAAEIDQNDPLLLERTGLLRLRSERMLAGYELLLKALELGGERPGVLNGLAFYQYERGDGSKAVPYFQQVLKLVPKPRKPREGPVPPTPVPRLYASRGLELIEDLGRLEVWKADFDGPDSPTLGGWTEVERFGIEIARQSGQVVLSGRQSGEPDGVTSAMLEIPIEVRTFDRVALEARVDSGRARLGLRLEGRSSRTNATAGLVFYRDLDGLLRIQVMTTRGDWEPVDPVAEEEEDQSRGRLWFPGTSRWPDDSAFHTMEIRQARGDGRLSASRGYGFDLYFDGEAIARNVRVSGLGGVHYEVGFSGQSDAIGNEYSITAKSFRVYRERTRIERSSERR